MDFHQIWKQIAKRNDELNSLYSLFWEQYSDWGNWQFWVVVALLILPLIILFFTLDRTRLFEILFFGYTVHVIWTYTDIALGRANFISHQYFVSPILPNATNITASVLPVGFLLVYQYCTNRKKNFYLYTILLSAVYAFVFASMEEWMGLLKLSNGLGNIHLFLIDMGVAFIAYWFTKFLLHVKNKAINKRELL